MHLLQCSIPLAGYPRGVASRPSSDGSGIETLVATSHGELRILFGTDKRGPLEFGAALEMYVPAKAGTAPTQFEPTGSFRDPVWDPFSSSIFLLDGQAVMRLAPNNTVTVVAGHRGEVGDVDGQGAAARFGFPRFPTPDGAGSLFLADGSRICRVRLPTVWQAGGQSAEPSRTTFPFESEVTTLLTVPGEISGLAFVPDPHHPTAAAERQQQGAGVSQLGLGSGGSLIYATETAVYRLPLPAPAADGDDGGADAPTPVLLAGCEGAQGCCDGRGSAARFSHISGLVANGGGGSGADGDGGCCKIYLSDVDDDDCEGAAVRCLTLPLPAGGCLKLPPPAGGDGAVVVTVTPTLEGNAIWPTILPNGYLALCNMFPGALLLLDLGLTPPRGSATAAAAAAAGGSAAGPAGSAGRISSAGGSAAGTAAAAASGGGGRRTLSSDLGDLLDRQPDGTSDLVLSVGGRTFHIHRGILSARCDYFRQRLTGAFPDASASPATPLTLPDADPDAFAALLRFLYTGAPPDPDPHPPFTSSSSLLCPLAELADRLLLPELCAAAQAQLLAAVTADNVVDLLIWASERGPAFAGAASRLVSWYLEHQVQVMEGSPGSVKRLMVSCPDLAFEVHMAAARMAARR